MDRDDDRRGRDDERDGSGGRGRARQDRGGREGRDDRESRGESRRSERSGRDGRDDRGRDDRGPDDRGRDDRGGRDRGASPMGDDEKRIIDTIVASVVEHMDRLIEAKLNGIRADLLARGMLKPLPGDDLAHKPASQESRPGSAPEASGGEAKKAGPEPKPEPEG